MLGLKARTFAQRVIHVFDLLLTALLLLLVLFINFWRLRAHLAGTSEGAVNFA